MQKRKWVLVVAMGVCAAAGAARADEAREQELAGRVEQLEKRLAEVTDGLRGGYFTANSDLEARVAELERTSLDDKGGMSQMFKNGLKSQSEDKAFSYQWFGLFQNDWAFYGGNGDAETAAAVGNPLNPGAEMRRVRLGAKGTIYGNVNFQEEIDFTHGAISFADMWVELANTPVGKIRVGHQKEPIGFDQLTSDRNVQFMERGFVNALSPGRNNGILVHGPVADDFLYQVGMFRDTNGAADDLKNEKAGEYNISARLSGRPMIEDDGKTWLHVGVSGRMSDLSDDAFSVSAKPAVNQAPAFLKAAGVAQSAHQFGFEAAYVNGPWSFLAEYGTESFNVDGGKDPSLHAYSIEGAYWLTGENTGYDKGKGTFGGTSPKHNFGDGDGIGAWQLALRYDHIDFTDDPIDAGKMSQWTFGAKWYLNPLTTVHFDVARVMPDEPSDVLNDVTLLALRFEIEF